MSTITSFGLWLKQRRKALDLTQDELAGRIGCSVETIRKIEADERRPSKQVATLLAEHLSIPAADRAVFLQCARAELRVERLATLISTTPLPSGDYMANPLHTRAMRTPKVTPPADPAPPAPSGTVTFLFTDIESSSRLWEQHEEAMQAAFARHKAILREAIAAHGGTVFKAGSDALYAAFATAPAAVAAALAIQRTLQAEAWGATGPLRVRMALHTGAAELYDGDYSGLPLKRVERMLAAGYGGQILLSCATQELVRDHLPPDTTLRDLGTRRLKDISRPEQIFQLIAPDLPTSFPPLKTIEQRPTNLPAQPTPLIGRGRDVAGACALLRRPGVRLVALTGPGGTGKTRLAIQVAAEMIDEFPNGVFFVPLAPISDRALVAPTIAQALGILDTGGRAPSDRLKDYLRDKQLLLLLDNFEQVASAALLVAQLLAAAPRLKILVTSRAVLHLFGEHEFPVPPLALPDPQRLPNSEALGQIAAVELFVQRAQAVKSDFAVTSVNAAAVADICIRLDGLPLAIELAAARSKMLSPQAMLVRLDHRLTLLTDGAQDLPTRHQTLRNTIDWSYALLDPSEQLLFARLAIFVGGATLAAVEAVCNATGDLTIGVLTGVESLLNKSLLRQETGADGEPRFVMLETIREYALERLAASGEVEALRRRHAEYYLALAEATQPETWGMPQGAGLDQIAIEYDNLRAALDWSRAHAREEIGLRLAGTLWWFWGIRGYLREGRAWLGSFLTQVTEPTMARAKALLGAGYLADSQGDYDDARTLIEESLTISRALGNKRGIIYALIFLGLVILSQGEDARTALLLEESLELGRALNDKCGVAWSLFGLGLVAYARGDDMRAIALYDESLALSKELESKLNIILSLNNLALVTLCQGNHTRASALLKESLMLSQTLGDKRGIAWSFYYLGTAALDQGEYARAQTYYKESLTLRRDVEDRRGIAECLEGLAGVVIAQGQPTQAARLCGAAEVLREAGNVPRSVANRPRYERIVAATRAELGEDRFADEWATGRATPLEQVITAVLEE